MSREGHPTPRGLPGAVSGVSCASRARWGTSQRRAKRLVPSDPPNPTWRQTDPGSGGRRPSLVLGRSVGEGWGLRPGVLAGTRRVAVGAAGPDVVGSHPRRAQTHPSAPPGILGGAGAGRVGGRGGVRVGGRSRTLRRRPTSLSLQQRKPRSIGTFGALPTFGGLKSLGVRRSLGEWGVASPGAPQACYLRAHPSMKGAQVIYSRLVRIGLLQGTIQGCACRSFGDLPLRPAPGPDALTSSSPTALPVRPGSLGPRRLRGVSLPAR